jgi:hypothetical protein
MMFLETVTVYSENLGNPQINFEDEVSCYLTSEATVHVIAI